ncbi:MAG: YbaK/EbsC family protein [Planctomycetes bacterium]|nr:YbaK/EbsC family protein [Planctomycetota bacterium]
MSDSPPPIDALLRERGIAATSIRPSLPTPTVAAAAQALGVPESAIVKSVLFESRDGGRMVLVVARGGSRISPARLEAECGLTRPRVASPETVRRATGYPAGGVPPVALPESLEVVIDRAVLDMPEVIAGGGDEHTLLRLAPSEIVRSQNARVADVAG